MSKIQTKDVCQQLTQALNMSWDDGNRVCVLMDEDEGLVKGWGIVSISDNGAMCVKKRYDSLKDMLYHEYKKQS